MKTILVPTDFSNNADNALKYAIAIAKTQKAKLILIHAFHIDYLSSTFPAKFIEKEIQHAQDRVNNHLRIKAEWIEKSGEIKCDYISELGLASDVISRTIKEKKPDLVIMGTQGASGLKGVFIGSTTAKIIGKAKCPIIAIPAAAKYHEFKKILYTTDFHTSDILALEKLIELVKHFKAHINITHIYDGEFVEPQKKLLQKFQEKIERKIKYKDISYHIIRVKNIENELKRLSQRKSNDLLVMSTHSRFLLDKLMNKSITKKIVSHTNIPLLALQHKEDPLIVI